MSGDPERDEKKPRPAAPSGVLGGSGKRAESAPVEKDGRVPKSVFAHTILGLQVPSSTPAPTDSEPLRDPSDRPAPVPYKRAHGAWGGTMPMPEPNSQPGNRSSERMIAAKPVEVRAAAVVGTPESREPTVRMPTVATDTAVSARPPSNRAMPAPPPPSGAPPAMPQMPAPRSPVPQAAQASARAPQPKRDDPSVPRLSLGVEKIPSQEPSTKLELTGQSQPLQLSLDARDHVEASLRPSSSSQSRSALPWIALAVIVVLGGLAFMLTRGGEQPAPATPERVEAVPAADPNAAPSAATPTAQDPAQAAVPPSTAPAVVPPPTAPAAPVVAPPAAKPAPAATAQPKEQTAAKPVAKPKTTRRTKKRAVSSSGPVLKVTPSGESDLEAAARAAERLAEPEEDLEPPEPAPPPPPDGE